LVVTAAAAFDKNPFGLGPVQLIGFFGGRGINELLHRILSESVLEFL
jgi:hypothetical protein